MSASQPTHAEQILAAAPDAVVVIDGEGLVRDWNLAAEHLFGYTRDQALGRELAELVIPSPLRSRHRDGITRYARTGRSAIVGRRVELVALHADGREFPIELTVAEVRDAGERTFVGFVRDVTAAHRDLARRNSLEQRLAFLADAGAVLDESLELGETLERLAELPVRELCDLCIIDVAEEDGAIRPAAVAAAEAGVAADLRSVRLASPLRERSIHPVATVLRDRRAMLLPEMAGGFLDSIASGPEHGRLMHRLRYRSAIVTPLMHEGRVLGAVSMLRTSDSTPFDEEDLTLATELARRAATAVGNARQYELTRHIAVTLQQSLLPRTIPEIPGAELVVRYRAAGEAQLVGGDFYDAFALGDGRYGLVIGDVCGKGPEAAALTALARYTIRGAAAVESDPAAVLTALNAAVRLDQGADGRFLTAILAIVEPLEHSIRLDIASGGHPAPIIVRADGSSERVATSGPLLGVLPEVAFPLVTVVLGAGDTLLCYTDGITDAGAPRTVLLESDLATLVASGSPREPEAIADHLEHRALSFGTLRDDMALLLLTSRTAERPRGSGAAADDSLELPPLSANP